LKKVQLNLNKLVKLLTNFLQFPGSWFTSDMHLKVIPMLFYVKLSKMNKIQYNTAYGVQSVTGPNTLALTAVLCLLNTSIISFAITA